MYTLDTNVLSYYLKGELPVVEKLNKLLQEGEMFYISSITKAELMSDSKITEEKIANIEGILFYMTVVPFDDPSDESIGELAAELKRTYRIKLPDAAIAATAIHTESTLLTRNVKDFRKISELDVQSI